MVISDSRIFTLISDGYKVIIINGQGKNRECIEIVNPVLSKFQTTINSPMIECTTVFDPYPQYMAGLQDLTVDLTLRGGSFSMRSDPLIMGVDIFQHLSVTDYIDVINEKIKKL